MKIRVAWTIVLTLLVCGMAYTGGSGEDDDNGDDQLRYEGRETLQTVHTIRIDTTRGVVDDISSYQDRRLRVDVSLGRVYTLGGRISSYNLSGFRLKDDRKIRQRVVAIEFDVQDSWSTISHRSSTSIGWRRHYDIFWNVIGSIWGLPLGYGELMEDLRYYFRYDTNTFVGDRL